MTILITSDKSCSELEEEICSSDYLNKMEKGNVFILYSTQNTEL